MFVEFMNVLNHIDVLVFKRLYDSTPNVLKSTCLSSLQKLNLMHLNSCLDIDFLTIRVHCGTLKTHICYEKQNISKFNNNYCLF